MQRDWDRLGTELTKVWPDANGLVDAFNSANSGINDVRAMHRARRKLEALGYDLPTIKEKHASMLYEIEAPSTLVLDKGQRSFVVTSCTNNSELDAGFFSALKRFADDKESQLLVMPVNYKNIHTMQGQTKYTWPKEIYPYVLLDDLYVDDTILFSSARIRATAVNPLSGMQPIGKTCSAIYGHPQMAMSMVPAPADRNPKMLHTTGSVNKPCYSDTKDGSKASFHHTMSAIFVEVLHNGDFDISQLGWSEGEFHFYEEVWSANGREEDQPIEALYMGDYHNRYVSDEVKAWRDGVIAITQPSALVYGDLIDFASQNHHNTLLTHVRKAADGTNIVEHEVEECVDELNRIGRGRMNYIIGSNHNDALTMWLNRACKKEDYINMPYAWWLLSEVFNNEGVDHLELAMRGGLMVDYKFTSRNESLLFKGIDCSQHGDGFYRSPRAFANSMHKTIIGHTHSGCIEKGCWQVGTSTKDLGYRHGYSAWSIHDCMIYSNGERCMTFFHKQ